MTEPKEPEPDELVEPDFSEERVAEMRELNARAWAVARDGGAP